MNITIDNIKLLVQDLESVADMILSLYNKEYTIDIKSDDSPVTTADIKADKMIREILFKYYPSIPTISEEVPIPSYEDRQTMSQFWLVDPLDGTKEFINKTDEFAINIALIDEGVPIVGILYLPVFKEAIFTVKGEDVYSYKHGNFTIYGKQNEKSNIALISRSHKDDEALEILDVIEKNNFIKFEHKTLGSSHKQVAIINNSADIYVKMSPGPSEWDFAAGQILIEQSGGKVIDITTGDSPLYNKENFSMHGFIMLSSNFLNNYSL